MKPPPKPDTFHEIYQPSILTSFDDLLPLQVAANAQTAAPRSGDASPFHVRSTDSMTYGIDIGGVIQWLTFKNKQPVKENGEQSPMPRENSRGPEADQNETDMANRVFQFSFGGRPPEVADREREEYERYITEYTFNFDQRKLQARYSKAENEYYLKYLKRSYLVDYRLPPPSVGIYDDYVHSYTATEDRELLYKRYLVSNRLMSIRLRPRL